MGLPSVESRLGTQRPTPGQPQHIQVRQPDHCHRKTCSSSVTLKLPVGGESPIGSECCIRAPAAADLAPDAALDRSGVTRRASRLEAAGLIQREPNPFDRRATLIVLTSSGERVVTELRERLAAHIARSLES
jgi:hypothetical protein